MSRRDAINRRLWALGRRHGGRLPVGVRRALIAAGSAVAVRAGGDGIDRARRTLSIAAGRPVGRGELRAAVASYLRMVTEVLSLPGWSPEQIRASVRVTREGELRAAVAGRGAVVALPHSANWDLAGAWACSTGLPVTTVAERLVDSEWEAFVSLRERLGMEVLPHTEPALVQQLVSAVRRGRVVCLIAERDLGGAGGVEVDWAGRRVRVPAGPALVARLSGAALFPGVCHYTGRPGSGGMVITLAEPVEHRPGRDGLVAMTQQVIDHFADRISRRVHDWHMFQPFFDDEPAGERR